MAMILPYENNPNSDFELQRTTRPQRPSPDVVWEQDAFCYIGYGAVHMAEGLSKLDLAHKESFKQAALAFSIKGSYTRTAIISLMYAINKTLKRTTARTLDETWISQAVESPTVAVNIKSIRNFFIFWKAQDPLAISNEALELLIKLRIPRNKNRNVLSDDPEKSWLSDEEYEAVLASVWRNYEEGQFSASRTLLALLSMQYARRPVQLANLKIKDFRIAAKGDISGLTGPLVSFPGAKDLNAETGFRDSRFEHHPLPSHLWSLFEIHRKEIRAMIELHLGSRRRQKLSATPDLSGTVLPYVLFRTQRCRACHHSS